ncbi:glycosyltransferase [Aquincola sp. MAHUQ-54]|uniref:Glycosyltransferase n=1 Tax=Aquincola agrisoli TaxID=3119538 RepID=A0AAW9QI31_9BURK
MLILLLGFAVSGLVTLLVIRSAHRHARFSADHDLSGPQKFHAKSVPRIGGLGIFLSVVTGIATIAAAAPEYLRPSLLLVACGLPAFAAGMIEDLTKRVSPRNRLIATAVSAGLAVWLLDASIVRTDLPGLDWVVSFPIGAALVTVFVVAGVANSINIIDGFNGLSSMCVVMMLMAVGYVAFQVGDRFVMLWALAAVGAVLGFFIWNFPAGLIFLGDGGAYFLGFLVSELAILLLHRNADVSPMFPLLICIYPVFETLFSIYRRRFLKEVSPGLPDGIHLHSLIYRRVIRWAVGSRNAREITRRNSMTSPYLWMLCMLSLVPSVLWWDSTPVLGVFIVLFGITYVSLYWRIVRFRSPRWMVLRR